jgi:hypothetical protein
MGAVSSIPDTELAVLEEAVRGHRGATLHLEMIPDDHWQQLFTCPLKEKTMPKTKKA